MNQNPRIQQLAERLYRVMPGAKMPAIVDGYYAWGEVDGTDHWQFCERIAAEMIAIREHVENIRIPIP